MYGIFDFFLDRLIPSERLTSNQMVSQKLISFAWTHQRPMEMKCIPHYTPYLYNENGVYRGIHFVLVLIQNMDCGGYPQSMF